MRVARETVSFFHSYPLWFEANENQKRSAPHYSFYNYVHSILVLMLWVLPINLPVLVVWVHNLAVHWLTPFSSHHNVLSIMPFILLVESLTGGTMIPRITNRYVFIPFLQLPRPHSPFPLLPTPLHLSLSLFLRIMR